MSYLKLTFLNDKIQKRKHWDIYYSEMKKHSIECPETFPNVCRKYRRNQPLQLWNIKFFSIVHFSMMIVLYFERDQNNKCSSSFSKLNETLFREYFGRRNWVNSFILDMKAEFLRGKFQWLICLTLYLYESQSRGVFSFLLKSTDVGNASGRKSEIGILYLVTKATCKFS